MLLLLMAMDLLGGATPPVGDPFPNTGKRRRRMAMLLLRRGLR